MKKITFFLLLLIFYTCTLFSQKYYVANAGDDSNDGRTESTPWKSLSELKSRIQDGDTVLFRRGDIFRGSVNFNTDALNNLYLGNYGEQDDTLPIISGSIEITGWTLWQNGIYETTVAEDISELYADNQLMTLARFPNNGWLTIDQIGSGYIINNQLPNHPDDADNYWSGANMRFRAWSWWYETRYISTYDAGGKIYTSVEAKKHKWKFYLDNKLEELDSIGEWFYDNGTKKVYFKPPPGVNPDDLLMEGTVRASGFDISNTIIEGIWFRHQNEYGLNIKGTSEVRGCTLTGIGSDNGGAAIKATWSVSEARITGNHFQDNLNNGISWNENPSNGTSSLIQDNTFINTGSIPGKGGSGVWHACAIIIVNAQDMHIQYNYIDHCGYAGILLGEDGNFAEYNIIKRAMSTLNDGGGIYTNCNRSTIRHNIILDTEGDLESSGPWANLGHGIWPEFLSNFRENIIENNIVANSGANGLFLPNNFDCLVRGNIFYNNERAQMQLTGRNDNPTPQNHQVDSNVFFCAKPEQLALIYNPDYDYGTLHANYFCNPFEYEIIKGSSARNPEWFKTNVSYGDQAFKTDLYKVPDYRTWNHGHNLVLNETFDDTTILWEQHSYSSFPVEIEIDSHEELDGNVLKVNHQQGIAMIQYANELCFEEDQYYELTFDYVFDALYSSARGNNQEFKICVYFNDDRSDIAIYSVSVSEKVKKAWLVFQSPFNLNNAELCMYVSANEGNSIYIDNIRLSKVDVAIKEPLDETQLLYNDTKEVASYSPGAGEWRDIDGNEIIGDIELQPFTGIVLVRGEAGQFPGVIPDFSIPLPAETNICHISKRAIVYPNPNTGNFTIDNIKDINQIHIFDIYGKRITSATNSRNMENINFSTIPKGIYVIQLIDKKGKTEVHRVIVE